MCCTNVFKVILFKFLVFERGREKNLMLIEGNMILASEATPALLPLSWLVAIKSMMPSQCQ